MKVAESNINMWKVTRKCLATAYRSHVSIRVTRKFVYVVPSSLITVQSLVVVCRTV